MLLYNGSGFVKGNVFVDPRGNKFTFYKNTKNGKLFTMENGVRVGLTEGQVNKLKLLNEDTITKKFEATIDVLSKEEGGRHTPFFTNYSPQFYFGTTDITGTITLLNNIGLVNPGDKNIQIAVDLASNIAMEVGTEFSIREGGRIIATGKITKVY